MSNSAFKPINTTNVQNLTLDSTNSRVDSGLAVTATTFTPPISSIIVNPTTSTSKILIIVSLNYGNSITSGLGPIFTLLKNGTPIASPTSPSSRVPGMCMRGYNIPSTATGNFCWHYIDSPGSTSAITYSLRGSPIGGSAETEYINKSNTDGNTAGVPRAYSNMMIIELTS